MGDTFEKQVTQVEGVIRRLQQTFECPICLDLMNDPVSTKCDHKFCRLCLLQVLRPRNRAPCPICKESVTKRSLQVLPHWNAIVGKVAQLIEAFQRDTGCEFSAGGVQTYVTDHGWTDCLDVDGGVSHRVDGTAQLDTLVKRKNEQNSDLTRKRKAEDDMETVIYIEDVSQEASRPSNVKSHINISSAFAGSRCRKHRKTDCTKDVVDATTMDDRRECCQKQGVTVATGNTSSTTDVCVVDLVTTETRNNASNANDVSQVNNDKDCVMIEDTKGVKKGRKSGNGSGRGQHCTKNVPRTSESELLVCLAEESLGQVSGHSAGSQTVIAQPNPRRSLRSFRSDIRGKEINLPTQRATRSKVMTRSMGDGVTLSNGRRSSRKGKENVNGIDRCVNKNREDTKIQTIPLDTNDNANFDDIHKVCPDANGVINNDKELGKCSFAFGLTCSDKTPEISSKVMTWLQTTADSVSPLSENIVVISEMKGSKTKSNNGGLVEDVSTQHDGGICTRSRGAQNDRRSSCGQPAVDVQKTAGRRSHGMEDLVSFVDRTHSAHQAKIRNADSADVTGIFKSPHVTKTMPCRAYGGVVSNVETKLADARNIGTREISRNASAKWIFRSGLDRSGKIDVNGITETDNASSVSQLDDPYLFIASPETPRRKKGRPKRGARQRNVTQKQCIDVVTISDKRGRNCGNGQKEIVESKDECELSELVEKISEAESYDLLLSQQFRDMEQIARSEQQMELVSGWGEVPDGARERQHPAGKWGTRGEGHKVIGDSEMMYEISQAQQSCGVETLDAADKETMQGIPEKPCQLQGRCRDSPVVGDISGKVERESGMMQLRRKVAGNVFPKDYGRKCSREEGTDKSLKCVKETLSVVINTAAEPTVKALKTSRGKRKGRGKRSRQHWKKKKATSGGDERGDDAALIARQDEQVEPSGDTETEADVFVEGGAASLSCVSEYTLENVTNGSQSQGHTVNDSNDRCSKSIFGDTPCGKDHLLGGDVHCKNDLDLNNCYVNKGVKERIVSLSEYELDGIILVPARHGHFSKGSPNSVVVVESGSSDEDGLPCSNETSGFEPMQDFELHVNAKVKSPMAPLEVPALNDEDSCPIERIPHDSPSPSKTPERGLCTYFTHNALVTGSQKTIDDQDTLSYDVHQGNHSTCDLECQKESPENLEKSPQNETGDDSEKPTTEDQDTEVVGCDDVCSLKSSRKTFSLNSSPLLRGPRESLELHNVLCEAAEMMQDTCGSVDPDLLERNSGHISPASSVSQKAPVFCTKREDTQNVPLDGVNSACKAVQKLSLKYGNHTTETSPKLLLNRIGPVCEKSQQDFGNKSDSRRKSRLLSPASKTKSTTSDHFSPTGETGDQTCSGRVIRKSTSRKPSTFGAGDFGEMFHSDSPTEICHPAEKSQRKVGKRKISRNRLGKGIEDSHGRVQCYAGSNVPPSGTLSGESESTLSAAAVVVKSVANLQMQPADRKADHLHSDTTFLSSDEVVLATTGASDDISPPIRVPYAASFKSSKNVRKKPRDKRMADSSQVAATTREGDLQNCHHVEMLHKEINTGKPRNPPTCERGIDTTEEYIKYRNDIEEANDRKGTGQTGVNVVMETMSCESNMSEESEESSSVLLSCIPPTMHEDTVPDQRVNDSRQGVATRDATQRVNGQIFANKKCTEDRGSSEQETEDGEDSDGNTTEEEDFSTDILENKKTAVTEAQTGRGPSPRENQKKLPLKNVSADARAEINSYLQPPGGNADKAKIVKMVTLPLNVVCDASVSSDKSSMLNSSSVSKRHTGPRRRILARRSLWSQGSSESRDWLRTSQSTAASTPLIPLVKRQSCDTVDLGKNETAQGVSQKCVSDDGQISLPVESVPGENYVENITMETQAHVTEARKKRHNVRDSREGETRDGSGTGGGVGKRELEPLNEGDIHYSEMSTLDGAEVLQTEEDSASPCHNPRGKNGLGGSSSIVASSPTAGTDIHGGNDDTVLSSDTVKGQCRGGVHAMRGLASWQWSSPIGILATKERDTDRSSLESVRDDGKGIGESQTHSTGCSVNEGCHDNLVEDNEPICCHSNASTTDSNDKGDISCELQERCHSNNVTSDDSDESRCDTINDDISRTSTGHQQFDDDDSDVDDLVLPTPQKQKPILKVAMEIHSVVMDSSSDIEQSSLEGVGGMADTCEDVNGNSEDFTVKKEIQEGSTEPIPRHERETQPVTPSGNPKRTLTSLPTTPSQPVWVEDRDLGSREEWERIRKNISDDLRFGKTDIPSPMTRNKPGGTGEVSEVEEVCQLDSDEEEEFVTLKRRTRKRQSVAELDSDSSETEDAPGGSTCHGNMTSSSGLSSQSDLPITQCKQKLETEVKSLQEQILQMEAAIAAGDGCNHGNPSANGNHGDTVDCLSGSADRTMSEKVQCIPATSSGEAGSSKRMPSCYVTKSPCDGRPSRFYGMSSSGTSKKSARLSRSSSCHDNNVVNLVDSDDEETPSSEVRHIKVHRRQYSGNNDRTDTQKVDMCRSQVSAGCHSNGGNLMDEEEGCDSVQNEDVVRCDSEENEDVDQCDGEENEDVDHCDSEENEDVDHGKDRRPENHTDVDDGEMEEGSCVEGEGGNETNDSGLDSDEDLFAPSEDIICIPQTITQEDVPVKPRYVLPLLTSTPRPSFDPCRSPPFSELQTADRRGLSTPPGADKMKHLDDEDILPSLEGDIDMVDESSDRGSTVKMFDNTCKSINICTSSNTCKSINTCTSSNTCCSSSNKTGFVKNGKKAKEQHNSLDCRRSSSNQNETMNNYAGATSRNNRQSVDVNRNGDENIDITKRSERRSMNSIEKKDLLCQNNMQMENKLTKELSPVMSMVAPPHRRCQKEAPSRGAVKDVDFPLRPGWVFIASGISKTIHQPGIDRLVRLLDSKFVSRYSPAVTHVLVNAAPPGSRRCARTLKYFQGVAGGKWVVNVHWALDSLTMQTLQPMKDYEISSDTGSDGTHNAPQRARCSSMPLLRKYEICCHGNFRDLTRDDLCGLVEACGAMTIQEPSMFTFDPNKVQVIIIEDSAVARMAELRKFQRRYQVALVQKEWLLDTISVYDIQPLEEYYVDGPSLK